MILSIQQMRQVLSGYQGGKRSEVSRPTAGSDEVSLSPEAEDFLVARQAVQESADRGDLVAHLQQAVATGNYRPDLGQVADQMLSGSLVDRLV